MALTGFRRSFLLAVTAACALAGPVQAIEAEEIATLPNDAYLAAYGGTVVWSEYDASARQYRLVAHRGGATRRLPVPGGGRVFDVDLGPGPDGRVRAVYSRCARTRVSEPDAPVSMPHFERGCRVWTYDFRRRVERRVAGLRRPGSSEYAPTIWRDRIAFARLERGRRARTRPTIQLETGRGAPRRVRGGTLGGGGAGIYGHPTRLDLRGGRLAFSWEHVAPHGTCEVRDKLAYSTATELWVVRLGERRDRVAEGCELDEALAFRSASRDGPDTYVLWVDEAGAYRVVRLRGL